MKKRFWAGGNICIFVLAVALTLGAVADVKAATYYVPDDYTTIQGAINGVVNGDEVIVRPGSYTENLNFSGKAITVRSNSGAEVTIIDGNASGSVVTFASYEGAGSVLEGFTITNGLTDYGGGIYCSTSSPTITNCTISSNTASYYGGGIYCHYYCSPTVVNSILWGDSPDEIYLLDSSSIDITYSDIQGGWTGTGNINCNPEFVGSGDYHLTGGSPCINVGTNDTITYPTLPSDDIDGDSRPQGAGYDMGSDEFLGGIVILDIWTSDYAGNSKTEFWPGANIRYNVELRVDGEVSKRYNSFAMGNVKGRPEWKYGLEKQGGWLYPGIYHYYWNETVPGEAIPPRGRVAIKVKCRRNIGDIVTDWMSYSFTIQPAE